jgi:hypothetical protein
LCIRVKFREFFISLALLFHYFEQKDSPEGEDGQTEAEFNETARVGGHQTQLVKMPKQNKTGLSNEQMFSVKIKSD